MRQNLLILANPAAGHARSGRRLARIVAALERRGCNIMVRHSGPEQGSLENLARTAEPEFDAVVAAGGDGTINAVANGITGSSRPLAVLPLGTVNLLARELALPHDPDALAKTLVTGPATPIWPGRVGERLFLMTASAGLDAAVVAALAPALKRRLGRLAFAPAMLRVLRSRTAELTVQTDGVEHRAATVIAMRGRYYAGPFVVAPEASLAHRQLHVLLLPRSGPAASMRYLAALAAGRLQHLPDVVTRRCRELTISAPGTAPVQADGEIVGMTPITIGLAQAPLRLIRPG